MKIENIKHLMIRRSEQAAGIAKSDVVRISSVIIGALVGVATLVRKK